MASRPNIYNMLPKKYLKSSYINPNKSLPIKHPFRLCIVGSSGTGKTSSLIWLIEESKAFHKIYLYAKKLDEPLYEFLIDDWKERSEKQGETLIEYSESLDDAVSFSEIDSSIQNLIIFDDMIVQKNLKYVEELFIRGRKSNCSVIFISQSYFKIPKIIRENSNFFLLTSGLSGHNLTSIATDQADSGEFKKAYKRFTKDGNHMLVDRINSRYYKNLGLGKSDTYKKDDEGDA